jgi:hypothetical protein
MMTKRIALLVVAALALAACQEAAAPTSRSPEPSLDPSQAVLDAMVAAYEAGTVHQEFRMDMSAGTQSFSFSGEADFDYDRRRGIMSMDLGVLGGEVDMIVDGTVTYMRSPAFAQQVPTEWVKMDLAKVDPKAAAQLGGGGMVDPSAYVNLFAGAVDVSEGGTEEVGGVATTRYEGTIDMRKAVDRFPAILGREAGTSARKALQESLDQLEALGVDAEVPFEIWIDDEGLPRRQRIAMDFGGLVPGAEDASMEIQVDFSAFGEPIDVDVPKGREVTDLTAALSAQASVQG